MRRAPFAIEPILQWLDDGPELRLDGRQPIVAKLAERIAALWLPDELVLYIGKVSELRRRVGGYRCGEAPKRLSEAAPFQ